MASLPLPQICESLRAEQRLWLSTHVSPDPDAIGSSFSLALALQSLGKEVYVHLADPLPEKLKPLAGGVLFGSNIPEAEIDAFVVVDTASRKRVGPSVEAIAAQAKRVYNIDHHVSNIGWADLNHIDANAAASAMIVWEMLKLLRVSPSRQMTNLLYGGLSDDTGGFCFSNTTPKALQCAAELVEAGCEPAYVSNLIYFSQPLRVLRLQAEALARLEMVLGGRVALLWVDKGVLERSEAKVEDTEGLVDLARKVEGTEAAVFARELEDGWKFSLRAKREDLDVNLIAGEFGGGGHRAAAGCKLVGTREHVCSQVLTKLESALNSLAPIRTDTQQS